VDPSKVLVGLEDRRCKDAKLLRVVVRETVKYHRYRLCRALRRDTWICLVASILRIQGVPEDAKREIDAPELPKDLFDYQGADRHRDKFVAIGDSPSALGISVTETSLQSRCA